MFDYLKQSYLLSAKWLQESVKSADDLDPKSAQKLDFYTRQFVDAMAPSNFLLTNPEVHRETVERRGENLVMGLENLLGDLERACASAQRAPVDRRVRPAARGGGP